MCLSPVYRFTLEALKGPARRGNERPAGTPAATLSDYCPRWTAASGRRFRLNFKIPMVTTQLDKADLRQAKSDRINRIHRISRHRRVCLWYDLMKPAILLSNSFGLLLFPVLPGLACDYLLTKNNASA